MVEIENVLKNGELVEYRQNHLKNESWLVRGSTAEKTMAVLCAQGDNDSLLILLSHLIPAPQWKAYNYTETREEDVMSTKMRNCFFCGGKIKPIVVGNFDYRLEGDLYVIRKIPAGLCLECGEKYVTASIAQRINQLIEAGGATGTAEVKTLEYS